MPTSATGTPSESSQLRKQFKRTDDFTRSVGRFFDAMADHSRIVLLVLAVLFLIGLGLTFYYNHREGMSDNARNELFEAKELMQKELGAYAATLPPEAPPAVKAPAGKTKAAAKDANKPVPRTVDSVRFTTFDVDTKLPETVRKFRALTAQYGTTRAGYEGRMSLAALYADHGQSDKALPLYEAAVDSAPGSFEKSLALYGLGYAQEMAGKSPDAVRTFDRALKIGDPGLKGELLLAEARNYELSKETAKARATYDQILAQLPNTEHARTAEVLRAQLQ